MSSSDGGPRLVVTPDDHRAIIVIVVIICMIWSIFVISARAIWRLHQKSAFGLDDSVALLGTLISVAQGGVTLAGVRIGFGLRERTLEPAQVERVGKYQYAAALLYILGLCASRASMPLLIARLTRDRAQLLWTQALLALTVVWGVGSTFGLAFGCGLPVPWINQARTKCSGLFASWAAVESTGLLLEALILVMAVSLVVNLNMLVKFKLAVVGSFTLRALLVIPVAFRLDLMRKIPQPNTGDAFFQTVDLTIITQIILHYSLWAASFPCMRAFLRAFDTGMGVTTGVPTYKGSNYNNETRGSSFALRSLNTRDLTNSQSKEVLRQQQISEPSSPASTHPPTTAGSYMSPDAIEKIGALNFGPGVRSHKTTITAATTPAAAAAAASNNSNNRTRANSDSERGKISAETASQNSRKAIITRTVEWTVEVQDASAGDTAGGAAASLPGRAL